MGDSKGWSGIVSMLSSPSAVRVAKSAEATIVREMTDSLCHLEALREPSLDDSLGKPPDPEDVRGNRGCLSPKCLTQPFIGAGCARQ